MSDHHHDGPVSDALADHIKLSTGQSAAKCYQCGKCSAGCPLAEEMDIPPSRMLRMLQLGDPKIEERLLSSYGIWLCLTCETCFVRCPKEVDIPRIMDFLRGEALRRGKAHPGSKKILAFHRAFLKSVRKGGRTHEMGLVIDYKMRTGKFMQDVNKVPRMFAAGKLHLLGRKIKGQEQVERIFRRTLDQEKEKE